MVVYFLIEETNDKLSKFVQISELDKCLQNNELTVNDNSVEKFSIEKCIMDQNN